MKTSRSPVFQENAYEGKKLDELMARLDELCALDPIQNPERREIISLQAELYRRMFRLSPRKPRGGPDVTVHAPEDELGNDDEEDDNEH